MKLKIYMGINVIYETYIPDRPVGLQVFFDQFNKPNIPVIAVAAGSSVYFIKDFDRL